MAARHHALKTVLEIQQQINRLARKQGQAKFSLIDNEELARIEELIEANTWPERWSGTEQTGDILMPKVLGEGVIQPTLFTYNN
jgi:DNA sulfur modification protein DndC